MQMKMSPATSVSSKQKMQPSSQQPLPASPKHAPRGTQDGEKEDAGPRQLKCISEEGSNEPRLLHLTIRRHGTTGGFQMGKGVRQGCILSPCLFNLYAEYIMRNAGLDEAQAGIKITGRNINNLRYADDTTLMAESEEELTSLLMKVKEENE